MKNKIVALMLMVSIAVSGMPALVYASDNVTEPTLVYEQEVSEDGGNVRGEQSDVEINQQEAVVLPENEIYQGCETQYENAIAEEETVDVIQGWVNDENGNILWYTDGKINTGFIEIEGNTYYFDEEGHRRTGWQKIGDKTYYFDDNGIAIDGWMNDEEGSKHWLVKGKSETGFAKIDGILYRFDSEGRALTGWVEYNNKMYYFAEDGTGYNGWVEDEAGKNHWIVNGKSETGFCKIEGDLYWFDSTGKMETGFRKINGKLYNFGADGRALDGWQTIGGKTYWFRNYKAETGFAKISGSLYWFDSKGRMETGFRKINGKLYNFGTDGRALDGWQTIGGKTYWFRNYKAETGLAKIGGELYYFNSSAVMQTGTHIINGFSYVFAEDGRCVNNMKLAYDSLWRTANLTSPTNYLVLVDKSNCHTMIYKKHNGGWTPIKDWLCTPGKPSTPSLSGIYHVQGRGMSFGWDKGYTCWYYTQISGNYLFHSVIYQKGSKTNIIDGRLGQQLSHGCVRLAMDNAKWMYDNIPNGTTIYLY